MVSRRSLTLLDISPQLPRHVPVKSRHIRSRPHQVTSRQVTSRQVTSPSGHVPVKSRPTSPSGHVLGKSRPRPRLLPTYSPHASQLAPRAPVAHLPGCLRRPRCGNKACARRAATRRAAATPKARPAGGRGAGLPAIRPSARPMMPTRGVRSSCDMAAKKFSCAASKTRARTHTHTQARARTYSRMTARACARLDERSVHPSSACVSVRPLAGLNVSEPLSPHIFLSHTQRRPA